MKGLTVGETIPPGAKGTTTAIIDTGKGHKPRKILTDFADQIDDWKKPKLLNPSALETVT